MDTVAIERDLRTRFARLWQRLGAAGSADACFDLLRDHYSEPARAYHTLEHVWWGLRRVEEIAAHESPNADVAPLELAMWFHDAVMRFGRSAQSDEAASAGVAARLIEAAGLPETLRSQVERLILATAHSDQAPPRAADEAILVDADLSILGADPEAFDEYERRIRREWSHVDDALFRAGRLQVLRRFVSSPRIFTTDYAHGRWELQARTNLERSIQKLERP